MYFITKEDFNEQGSPFFLTHQVVDSNMITLIESNIIKPEITEEENTYLYAC